MIGDNRSKRTDTEAIPDNLFDILPFKDDHSTNEEYKPFACIPFIPGGLSYRIKRALTKAGVNTVFKSGTKLSNILCNKNKTKIDPNKKKGVYRYTCKKCNKVYIGQTARSFETRWREHARAIEKGQWNHSGGITVASHSTTNTVMLSTCQTLKSSRLCRARTKRSLTTT